MMPFDQKLVSEAAAILRAGGLVAMPTETVYGLAADATNDKAVARIFEAKGRPRFNPLIVHVADAAMAGRFVEWPPLAEKLAAKFWPGPLTLVLPQRRSPLIPASFGTQKILHPEGAHEMRASRRTKDFSLLRRKRRERVDSDRREISLLVSAGLAAIAVRAPDHPIAQALIKAVGRPLAAPSANRSGAVSPTTATHVRESLGDKVDMILDGGSCSLGLESSIVKIDGENVLLLRPGGLAREEIEAVMGKPLAAPAPSQKPEAPGMLDRHYATHTPLRLNAKAPEKDEAFLGFGRVSHDGPFALNLSESGDLREAAANLFRHLRALDELAAKAGLTAIAVAPVLGDGLGEAINDRLARAAAR
jgi:L-threonylcarbamoyladenylate synthase